MSRGIAPAGEMWSVVTESPSTTRQRASTTSASGAGSGWRSWKNDGSRTYVEAGSQAKSAPSGAGSACQRSSPSQIVAYSRSNSSGVTLASTAARTSPLEGQRSRR